MDLLHLDFKGERNYLQGPDLFNAAECWAETRYGAEAFVSRLSFRAFARRQCAIVTDDEGGEGAVVATGEIASVNGAGPTREFRLIESDVVVVDRRDFDEESLLARSRIDGERRHASLTGPGIISPIEEATALTKQLHYAVAPEITGE